LIGLVGQHLTCGCRAASWMEKRPAFKSGDWVAPLLLPRKIQVLFKVPLFRHALTKVFGPEGVYEWVIARTKYIDDVFERALADGFVPNHRRRVRFPRDSLQNRGPRGESV
jgi:hypothetical protein